MAVTLKVTVAESAALKVANGDDAKLAAESFVVVSSTDQYTGPYEFTPTDQTQTVEIATLQAIQDITINPIPNNYGLITWNGSVLTVS